MRPSNWCRLGEAGLVGMHHPHKSVWPCAACAVLGWCRDWAQYASTDVGSQVRNLKGPFCGSVCQWWQTA